MSISECLICKRILYNLLCLIFIIIGEAGIRSYLLKTKQTLDRKGVWGRGDTCVCLAESLCCSPETITALLTGYIPIQNKKAKKKNQLKRFQKVQNIYYRYSYLFIQALSSFPYLTQLCEVVQTVSRSFSSIWASLSVGVSVQRVCGFGEKLSKLTSNSFPILRS